MPLPPATEKKVIAFPSISIVTQCRTPKGNKHPPYLVKKAVFIRLTTTNHENPLIVGMPYTPPSHRSPASSAPTSPDLSRRSSFHATADRPSLPRSSSYLAKHRRAPSASSIHSHGTVISQPTPSATSVDLKGMASMASIRQSPPPVTDGRAMPNGAIISPPESQSNSDDDDLPEMRGRKIENLHELHAAISQIPQHRSSSPTKSKQDAGDLIVLPSQTAILADSLHHSFSAISLDDMGSMSRMISHSRSITEPNAKLTQPIDTSMTASEEESEGELMRKPQMVRKKSGELVRPALRPPSRRRPSSMPGTPTFSKAVHFDSHLEHVRHFLQVDRPLAVSAGSSPADNYDSDTEYPFGKEEKRTPPFEWEIIMSNFPVETPTRKAQAVRLERVWLSNDQKSLTGSVAVANLAFNKTVTCRFTLDYWKTTSEIAAEYVAEIRPKEIPQGHDRFHFTIKLSDLANLETKTLYFCIRYSVNGQEIWDNNDGTNFQIDFKKKMLPQNGKNGLQGASSRPANGLPRSNRRNQGSILRPKSAGFDDFGGNSKVNFDQSIQDYLGESGPTLRLKGIKSATNLPSDNLTSRLASPSGQAFANRYDFGASLTAAVQAAKDAINPDGLFMKPNRRVNAPKAPAMPPRITTTAAPAASNDSAASTNKSLPPVSNPSGPPPPAGPTGISSATYEELVNKYCFFGSKQSSPQLADGTLQGGQMDGAMENLVTNSTNSTNPSLAGTPLHLSNLRTDVNPFFQNAFAASPVTLTLQPPSSNTSMTTITTSQPRQHSSRAVSPAVSPGSMGSAFSPFAGTSPNEFSYHMQDRFPFTGPEAHTATAIRG